MKKLLFVAAAVIASIGAMAQQKIDDVIKVNSERYDFGKIKQGVPVTTFFTITNSTDKPIVIESASASCGCTTPEYSREPIAPGGSTQMKVGYNAASMGTFTKPITIKLAGVAETKVVNIVGEVVDPNAGGAITTNAPKVQAAPAVKSEKVATLKPVQKAKLKSKTTAKASK